MHTVGNRKEHPITFHASAAALKRGLQFNDELHRTFNTKNTGIRKGVYYFKSHKEANEHQKRFIAKKMAELARENKPVHESK